MLKAAQSFSGLRRFSRPAPQLAAGGGNSLGWWYGTAQEIRPRRDARCHCRRILGQQLCATSTEDLCARTGLSRSSLYNAFQSKPASYRLALARYGDAKAAQRQHYAQLPGTGRDVLRHLMSEVVAEQQGQSDRRSCLVVNACVELVAADPAESARVISTVLALV
jgi:hypothetical protein